MREVCFQQGCRDYASVVCSYNPESSVALLTEIIDEDASKPRGVLLCHSHADTLVVPTTWKLRDKRARKKQAEFAQFEDLQEAKFEDLQTTERRETKESNETIRETIPIDEQTGEIDAPAEGATEDTAEDTAEDAPASHKKTLLGENLDLQESPLLSRAFRSLAND